MILVLFRRRTQLGHPVWLIRPCYLGQCVDHCSQIAFRQRWPATDQRHDEQQETNQYRFIAISQPKMVYNIILHRTAPIRKPLVSAQGVCGQCS